MILFSNPATRDSRSRLTVRTSFDDGATWAASKILYPGPSAYSCLVALPDGEAGCLFEADDCGRIVFARLSREWLTGG